MISPPPPAFQRTSLQLYRDCLRLIRHVAPPNSAKHVAVKAAVKREFAKHMTVTDAQQIETLKGNAIRALSNYLLATAAPQDPTVSAAVNEFTGRSVRQAKEEQMKQEHAPSAAGACKQDKK